MHTKATDFEVSSIKKIVI